jgi:hypothetical protein
MDPNWLKKPHFYAEKTRETHLHYIKYYIGHIGHTHEYRRNRMVFFLSLRVKDVKGEERKPFLILFLSSLPRVAILHTPVVSSINRKE